MYKQHCIAGLSEDVGALRNAALYVAEHRDAILWALELCGFKDVALKVKASPGNIRRLQPTAKWL